MVASLPRRWLCKYAISADVNLFMCFPSPILPCRTCASQLYHHLLTDIAGSYAGYPGHLCGCRCLRARSEKFFLRTCGKLFVLTACVAQNVPSRGRARLALRALTSGKFTRETK